VYQPKTDYPEHLWCSITGLHKDSLLIAICYRTNNIGIFGEQIDCLLRDLLQEVSNHRLLLTGDFNYSNISWNGSACLAMPDEDQYSTTIKLILTALGRS